MFQDDRYGLVVCSGRHYLNPIELKNVHVSCDVTHLVSNVKTTFIYQNQFEEPVEAQFVFPLDCVSVYAFEARVQDRVVVAKCRPKAEARQTYSEAVQKGHTAILAEQSEHCEDIFKTKIGNIPTKETVTVILKYAGHLDSRNVEDDPTCSSEAVFTLPSVINPRYSPDDNVIKSEFEVPERCYQTNPSKYGFSFEADLFMPVDVVNVSSEKDTYKVDFGPSDHKCVKVKMTSSFEPNHDLQMVIKMSEKLDSFAVCEPGTSSLPGILSMNCVMAEFVPDFSKVCTEQESRTEIHFIVDRSGSMAGSNIQNASESLLLLLKSLPVGCRFQIIGFGSVYSKLFPEPVDYTEETMKQAIEYQRNLKADMGGTEVLPALKAAYSSPLTGEGWFKQIIFLTDGDVSNADEVVGLVASNIGQARLFAIGIGEGASTYLVSGVARAGRGVATFIRQNSQMRGAVMRILGMALQPRASSVQIEWKLHERGTGGQETPLDVITVPSVPPPAFTGHWIKAFGFVKNVDIAKIKGEVNLTCVVFDQKQSFSIKIPSSVQNRLPADATDAPLHRLAGKCQMTELCDRYKGLLMSKDEGDQNLEALQLRSQIEQLSCALNIASPYTALVGVDAKQQDPILVQPDPVMECDDDMDEEFGGGALRPCGFACEDRAISGAAFSARCQNFEFDDLVPQCEGFSAEYELCEPACVSEEAEYEDEDLAYEDQPTSDATAKWETAGEVPAKEAAPPTSSLLQLTDLQEFQGFWKLDSALADCVGIKFEVLTKNQPKQWPAPHLFQMDDKVWATALALAFLEIQHPDATDEWSLLARKAKMWIGKQVFGSSKLNDSQNEAIKVVIEQAKRVLSTIQ